ncbi:MAG: Gfo/Idh/MocA family oxidoreductase [Planctomycetota bacterium]
MKKTYRIGIVGVGAIAGIHAKAIRDIDGAQMVAFCNGVEPRIGEFRDEYGGEYYEDYQAMIAGAELDVVTICTPSGAHMEPTVAALEAGVSVLCEKPLEVDLERAGKMLDAARASAGRLGSVFPQRFNPVVQAAHEAAKAGRLGTLGMAAAYVPWWRDDAYYGPNRWQGTKKLDGGGALINQSIHAVDAMQWLADAAGAGPAVEVSAYSNMLCHNPEHIEVEDCCAAAVRFEKGPLGVILASTAMWPGGAVRFHVGGRDGSIEVHEDELVTWRFRDETAEDEATRERFGGATAEGGAADPMAIDYSKHTRNIEDFLRALDEDRPSLVEPEEAWKSLAIIRAVYDSAESGKPAAVVYK